MNNEEQSLPELHRRLVAALDGLGLAYEILYVDDGSTDASLDLLRAMASDRAVRVLSLSRNFGHQAAIVAGLEHAEGAAVVTMDADLQDPPELIPELVAQWRSGHDVVSAQRSSRDGERWLRTASIRLYYRLLARIAEHPISIDVGDYRLIDRRVVDVLIAMPESPKYVRGLVAWAGFSHVVLPYARPARFAGASKFTFRKLMGLALRGVTSSTKWPLHAIAGMGVCLLAVGIGLGAYMLASAASDPFPLSVVATITAVSGVQIVALGLVALYVGQLIDQVRARPAYLVAWDSAADRADSDAGRAASA